MTLSKTLFGRLFVLVPSHFKNHCRDDSMHYYEEFKLGTKIRGVFYYNFCTKNESTIILKPSHGRFYFQENINQNNGVFQTQLLTVGPHHSCILQFDDLGKKMVSFIDNKNDSDIISCSCCKPQF